jgi:hypothetical protein
MVSHMDGMFTKEKSSTFGFNYYSLSKQNLQNSIIPSNLASSSRSKKMITLFSELPYQAIDGQISC